MSITRKITAGLIAAGIALTGAPAVAQAQSLDLFGNLSSSSAPTTPRVEDAQDKLRETIIEKLENDGYTITDESNEAAQAGAERVAAGESVRSLGDGYEGGNPIPNVLLGAYIEEIERMNHFFPPNYQTEVGIGIAGTEHSTYLVFYFDDLANNVPNDREDLP